MKKLALLLIGLTPLPLGYAMNHLMMTTYSHKVLPFGAIGAAFLAVWFAIGVLTYGFAESDLKAVAIAHTFGFANVLLVSFQELVRRQYWRNQVGVATQFFFLPLINLAARVPGLSHRLYQVCIIAFVLMCATFYLGRVVRKRQLQRLC